MEQTCLEYLQQITSLYSEFTANAAKHPTSIDRNSYGKLVLLHKLIAQFLNSAFSNNSALSVALHDIKKELPLPEYCAAFISAAESLDNCCRSIILPMSIPLPHHVVYADDPTLDITSIRRFSLVRTTSGLKIITRVICSYPMYAQDIDYLLHRSPAYLRDFFLYTNKTVTAQQLCDMRPLMQASTAPSGTLKMTASYATPPPLAYKYAGMAARGQIYRCQFRLNCGMQFYCYDLVFSDRVSDSGELPELFAPQGSFASPISAFDLGVSGCTYNYAQIQPLFDPFEDLIVARTGGFCAYFDKYTRSFYLGKVVAQPSRVNRFHYSLQRACVDLARLRERLDNRAILSVLGECATVAPETFYVYCKFVCGLVGCYNVQDDVLVALTEDEIDRDTARERFTRYWIESLIGKWANS